MTFDDLLQRILAAATEPFGGEGLGPAVEHLAERRSQSSDDFQASLVTCSQVDRPWLVYAIALQAALRRLLEDRAATPTSLGSSEILCFCASEAGGNHPRAIETVIQQGPGGGSTMRGVKRWATLAPVADRLLVIASVGWKDERNHLRALLVPADTPGLYVEDMTIPGAKGTTLHLPNGLVQIEDVRVLDEMMLPGDGYSDYLKPFRTLEDLFGSASRACAMLGLARRHEAPEAVIERIVGVLGSLQAVSDAPHRPASQLVIGAAEAALDEQLVDLVTSLPEPLAGWWTASAEMQVAATAKARRRSTALKRLGDSE